MSTQRGHENRLRRIRHHHKNLLERRGTKQRTQSRKQRHQKQSGDQNHQNNRKSSNEPKEPHDPESIEKMKLKLKEISSISPENLNQMDKLISNLSKQNYECLICMNNVKHHQAIWGCQTCYAIFHIFCIKKWAKNSLEQQANTQTPSELPKWRCPGCQTETATEPPNTYSCFCGKHKDPVHVLGAIPHSCGQICGKKSRICEHNCSSLCHPGPCPDCENYTTQTCPCDEENKRQVKCKATGGFFENVTKKGGDGEKTRNCEKYEENGRK